MLFRSRPARGRFLRWIRAARWGYIARVFAPSGEPAMNLVERKMVGLLEDLREHHHVIGEGAGRKALPGRSLSSHATGRPER